MKTFEITADVPDGFEVGSCELVDTRPQTRGDSDGTYLLSRIILRPVWKWPEWIRSGSWIAQGKCGLWRIFRSEPYESFGTWLSEGNDHGWTITKDGPIDFTPPFCTNWRQSKRQKPGA
jgi:hypothetical protein